MGITSGGFDQFGVKPSGSELSKLEVIPVPIHISPSDIGWDLAELLTTFVVEKMRAKKALAQRLRD